MRPDALLAAYARGWFPMDEEGATGAVGLYSTDPRAVIPIDAVRVPRSVRRALRRHQHDEVRVDAAFGEVARACAQGRTGVWLTPRLVDAYVALHEEGFAHSVEVWRNGRLAGGLFGVALGGLYTSESMFHREGDAGSAALVATAALLARGGFTLWDVQMASPHVTRFGAVEVPHRRYLTLLADALRRPARFPVP
ncbi:MAG: leucyl/phenylalanyl-tRNA--protein transferase [Actinomycetota bacterium]